MRKKWIIQLMFSLSVLISILTYSFFESEQVRALELDSENPIKQVYAGEEFAIFLHEDTSISGFGMNVESLFGATENISTLEKVSDPTGFTKLRVGKGYVFGLRPLPEDENLFDAYRIKKNNLTKVTTTYSNYVSDYSHSGRTGVIANPHDTLSYVGDDGYIYGSGSDYSVHLGVGSGRPHNHSVTGSKTNKTRALDSVTKQEIFLTNSGGDVTTETLLYENVGTFTKESGQDLTFKIKLSGVSGNNIQDTTTKFELIDANGIVKRTISNVHRGAYNLTNSDYVLDDNLPAGVYTIRASSMGIKWNLELSKRIYLENVAKVQRMTNANVNFVALDKNGQLYIHRGGFMEPAVFPTGPIKIKLDSLSESKSNFVLMEDEQGRIWSVTATNNPVLLNTPMFGSYSFYDVYDVIKTDVGNGFATLLVQNKKTGNTEIWSYGSNSFGRLGLGENGTVVTQKVTLPDGNIHTSNYTINSGTMPLSQLTRKGVVLENIQDIASGGNFFVFVQNIEEGKQMVWTAGKNNSGQLGGDMDVSIYTPAVIPGLLNMTNIQSQHAAELLIANDTSMYSFGGNKSYPSGYNAPNSAQVGIVKDFHQRSTSYFRENLNTTPTAPSVLISLANHIPFGFGGNYMASTGSVSPTGAGKIAINNLYLGKTELGRDSSTDIYFDNIKNATNTGFSGVLVDKNGRAWGWGTFSNATAGSSMNIRTVSGDGRYNGLHLAHPSLISEGVYAPNIFVDVVGATSGNSYFLTNEGKIWVGSTYLNPIASNSPINNVKIVKLFGGLSSLSYALDENGEIWTLNGTTATKRPKTQFNNKKIIQVSANINHRLFLDESGDVWSEGTNTYGKLGLGDNTNRSTPVKIDNLKNVVYIATSTESSYAIDEFGRTWGWGYSAYGSLGNNFTMTRENLSTASGNSLPEMTINTAIENKYLSVNGNTTLTFGGEILEKDGEETSIRVTVLGVEKKYTILEEDWERNEYDEVIPKEWSLTWNIQEFNNPNLTFQTLTKFVAEDQMGGLVEQYFAGSIVIDNTLPETPDWGATCILDEVKQTETCVAPDYFKLNGTNATDKKVRIYFNPNQKTGANVAVTHIQLKYRIKEAYGYPNKWSDWIIVKPDINTGLYYYDFYQGFLGETQVKIRAVDGGNNVSGEVSDFRYVIISNAGGEIKELTASTENAKETLNNKIFIKPYSPDGTKNFQINVYRKLSNEDDEAWRLLTETPITSNTDAVYEYVDSNFLRGNTKYDYKIQVSNGLSYGAPKIISVTTTPYGPLNLLRANDDSSLTLTVKQSGENEKASGILYRFYIEDMLTGKTYFEDVSSTNALADVKTVIEQTEVDFPIVDNPLKMKILMKGLNGQFMTYDYDTYTAKTTESMDKEAPQVEIQLDTLGNNVLDKSKETDPQTGQKKKNLVDVVLYAFDNESNSENLKIQLSNDGITWYGEFTPGVWRENYMGKYNEVLKGFDVKTKLGNRVLYARVYDESNNIGKTYYKYVLSENVEKGDSNIIDSDSNKSPSEIGTVEGIHTNSSFVSLNIPKSGNVEEVQFSFDGITWSPWEVIKSGTNVKNISLPTTEGSYAIMVRYKNSYGEMTTVDRNADMMRYVLDKTAPKLTVETSNGTFMTKSNIVELMLKTEDDYSVENVIRLLNPELNLIINGSVVDSVTVGNTAHSIAGVGPLAAGFNNISFEVTDKAGNKRVQTIRIYRK